MVLGLPPVEVAHRHAARRDVRDAAGGLEEERFAIGGPKIQADQIGIAHIRYPALLPVWAARGRRDAGSAAPPAPYPFTAPNVSPRARKRWMISDSTIGGTIAISVFTAARLKFTPRVLRELRMKNGSV